MFLRRVFAIALVAAFAACSRNSTATESQAPRGSAASRTSDVIGPDELWSDIVRTGTALEAVRRLRPRFLANRGASSINVKNAGSVRVSVDGGPLQALSFLERIRPFEIAEIRYLNANDAAQRFGTSSGTGSVLLIRSR